MQSVYAFYGSRLHLYLEDEIADAYNRMAKAFYDAQVRHKEMHGVQWDPELPLLADFDPEDHKIWNKVGELINHMIELNGGGLEIPEEEMTSDYLVKL